jgi:predicted RND superfamily exporter protein
MWRRLGQFILQYRFLLLIILAALTGAMGYWASKVQLSYDFARAIPTDNPKYRAYQDFKQKFGEDGNLVVVGIKISKDSLFKEKLFNSYASLQRSLRTVNGVDDVIAVPSAVNLVRDTTSDRLRADSIFFNRAMTQAEIDSAATTFLNLPFYKHLLYSVDTTAWLMGVRINKQILNTGARIGVVNGIEKLVDQFSTDNNIEVYKSGLPLIRTKLSVRIVGEMRWFLITSVVLSALILLLFFRSFSSMLLSLAVVIIGVLWSMGTMHLLGYKITLLTGLIPPLLVVIGIPNCIYFLNKFHTSYNETGDKKTALVNMVGKMGIVTLFCNVAAAIGFAVFALTKSQILKEFGVVAGINIMVLFFISLILIPAILSLLPAPKSRHTKYLDNPRLNRWLDRLERWTLNHRRLIYVVTTVIVAFSIVGMFRLKSVGYIVDDLPKTDRIYTDLKFFEANFKGVMPLEIVVSTEAKKGLYKSRLLPVLVKMDSLSDFIMTIPGMARPLSIAEGSKFVKQSYFGDVNEYSIPSSHDVWLADAFSKNPEDSAAPVNDFDRLLATFMDTSKQQTRISVSMADVGSNRLPDILDSVQKKADSIFPKPKFNVQLTGTSVTFVEGSTYIINGLKESIGWAFLLIALCMLYLFKSFRILICSLVPNLIPLVITAGVMGWTGVPIKPSTVLVFSVALGIAIDVTIRFLVNYKQELPLHNNDLKTTVIETIHNTGISIIYTSLVLIAGFIIFCFSGFGGTQALGWLTSLTLITATVTNLVLLPALLISMGKKKDSK